MAIKKLITNSKGQNYEYHKIITASQMYMGEEKGISINLASYTSEEFRLLDEKEMIVNNTGIFLPIIDEEKYDRATLYERIKIEVADFIDAIDC